MQKRNIIHLARTKLLDTAVSSIRNRMNIFRNSFPSALYQEDFETDYNVAGKTWKRLENEGDNIFFAVGQYKLDKKTIESGFADFQIKYDLINHAIKDIYILL